MLPHMGQGANQAIEDGVALAAVLSHANPETAPLALQVYESVRRERTARVQLNARANGPRYGTATPDLCSRDPKLATPGPDPARIWDSDAAPHAPPPTSTPAPPPPRPPP